MKLFQITEATRVDTKTDTKSAEDILKRQQNGMFDNDLSNKAMSKPTRSRPPAAKPKHKQAGSVQTKARSSNVDVGDEGRNHMSNFADTAEFSDDDIANDNANFNPNGIEQDVGTDVTTPDTLPAVINKAVADSNGDFELEWNQVKDLPGYMQQGIRILGRQIFATQTDTPIEKIQVLANIKDQGPNTKQEILAFGGWLKHNAVKDDQFDMDFEASMPGYNAEVAVYRSNNATFMLVQDFAGQYVYAWPGGRGVQIGKDKSPDQMSHDTDSLGWMN